MKKLYIGLFFALFYAGLIQAQPALGIGAGRVIWGIEDTICGDYTYSDVYLVYVKNKGNALFSGVITMHTEVDSGQGFIQDGPLDTFPATLNPGDSVQYIHTHTYDTLNTDVFRMGGNIVVIWPSAQSVNTVDSSLFTPVYIALCSSIAEIDEDKNLSIYPNPSNGNISVISRGRQNLVRSIRVLDLSGRELITYSNTNIISMADYANGIYFLEVTFSDKSQKTFKIIRKE
jgi:hypothetical protein